MKLVFEPGEKKAIEDVHKCVQPLFEEGDIGKEFDIKIKLTDPAVADVILGGLLHGRLPEVDPGFKVTAICYRALLDKDETKKKIINAVTAILDA